MEALLHGTYNIILLALKPYGRSFLLDVVRMLLPWVYQHITDIIFKNLILKQFPTADTQEMVANVHTQLDYKKNALIAQPNLSRINNLLVLILPNVWQQGKEAQSIL